MQASSEFSDEQFEPEVGNEINFKEVLQRYLKHWKWIMLSVFVMLVLGFVFARTRVPLFKIDTAILIKDKESSSDKDILQQLEMFSSDKIIDNEIQILKTSDLMKKVIQSLDLQNNYTVDRRFSKYTLYHDVPLKVQLLKANDQTFLQTWPVKALNDNEVEFNGKKIPYNKPVETEAGLIVVTPTQVKSNEKIQVSFGTVEGVAMGYINKLVITPASKQATVLFITMEDENAQRGKDILTKLVDEYNQISIDDKNKTTANTLAFIESRLTSVATELNSVEKKVQDYKSTNKITDISAQSSIFLAEVQNNDQQLSKINLELGVLKTIEDYLRNSTMEQMKLPAMQGVDDPSLLVLMQQLADAQVKRESLLRTTPATNPNVSSINDQILALRKTALQTMQNVRSGLLNNRAQLLKQNSKFNDVIRDVPAKERGLIDVMRDRDIKNNLFTFLLQKREETAMSLASTVSDSKTIDTAKSSSMYFKPAKSVIYIAFFAMGLLIPIGIIYISDVVDSTVKKRSDVERFTRVPIIAQLSYTPENNSLITLERPRSMVAEQIRGLRTNLQFILPNNDHKVILFTSNISGEGKSFIALNLSASLATTGKKVIVLELDLRKPRFDVILGLKPGQGLSNYLIEQADYKSIVKPHAQEPNLHIITSGPIPPNPAELLLNGRIEKLVEELRKEYDYIIMDAPPIGLLTDAHILSKHADATLFIVRYAYTHKEQIQLIEDLRRKRVFNNLNIVFNSVDKSKTGYGYGYGYGYYDEDTSKRSTLTKRFRG